MTSDPSKPNRQGLQVAIWRWHLYAGILTVPFLVILGITGAVYLFKPYVEPIMYADKWFHDSAGEPLTLQQQLDAVTTSVPQSKPTKITTYVAPSRTSQVMVRDRDGGQVIVFVNPVTGSVTGTLQRDEMLMRKVRNLHGELWTGRYGSAIVELTACWTLMLVCTGVYLWFPRGKSKMWGVWLPRLRSGSRLFWRDVHSVTAVWASALIVILVITGLPWSNVWGGAMKRVQAKMGQAAPPAASRRPVLRSSQPEDRVSLSIEQALKIAAPTGGQREMTISLPRGPRGTYGFSFQGESFSDTHYIHVDQYSGALVGQARWADHPLWAKTITVGIRLHQGELFGILNVLLMLFASLSLPLIAVSGLVMWWKRRPAGSLGIPERPRDWRAPKPIVAMTIGFAIVFPLVALSMIVFYVLEMGLLRRRVVSR